MCYIYRSLLSRWVIFEASNVLFSLCTLGQILCEVQEKHLVIYDLHDLDSPMYKIHLLELRSKAVPSGTANFLGHDGALLLATPPLDTLWTKSAVKRHLETGALYLFTKDHDDALKWSRDLRDRTAQLLTLPETERFELDDLLGLEPLKAGGIARFLTDEDLHADWEEGRDTFVCHDSSSRHYRRCTVGEVDMNTGEVLIQEGTSKPQYWPRYVRPIPVMCFRQFSAQISPGMHV